MLAAASMMTVLRYCQNSGSSAKLVGRLSILTCRWISVVFVRFLLWLRLTPPQRGIATGKCSMALRPGLLRHLIRDSSTASSSFGQRRNKDFSAHVPSMRAS